MDFENNRGVKFLSENNRYYVNKQPHPGATPPNLRGGSQKKKFEKFILDQFVEIYNKKNFDFLLGPNFFPLVIFWAGDDIIENFKMLESG